MKIILVAREVWAELTPGKKFLFWTFNGTVPGPMLRVMVGDHVNLTLINGLTSSENQEPHNIDFHAVMGPGGGASVTNVKPGETKWVRFKALREGSYIYHCAGEDKPWEHIAHGMYGLIEVEPQGGLSPVDKEFYIGQSEWYTEQDEKKGPAFFNLDDEKATLEHPDLYTFNGHFNALNQLKTNDTKGSMIFNMTTKQGDKVRLFFVDGGPNVGSNFHIIGTILDKVYTAHSEDYVRNEETVYVPPGSAAVFELQTPVPGDYSLVDHALWRVPRGALGILHVNQTDLWPSDVYAPEP